MADASALTALLGPTNTGKTHRAVERMLEHASGMIGLPLRLLAREVYDRVSAKVGEGRVALVTGEEQRVPPRPSYWIATVEAMPATVDVDFLAVDEVQLAAHRQRGHVFTSRLLRARGRQETWFLGAGTMAGVIAQLTPTAHIEAHPRLSKLSFAGEASLLRLPPRSAVVAFSVPHAYQLAEHLRGKRGGAAVVMGALSPRTRNAQVAMFQAGEVDYLVATDAIGMGLNLDVGHVAFAALRKFDGAGAREVLDDELAQIAGRAGRWTENGTFGTLSPLTLPLASARAIETSHFPAVRRVRWRNDDLDWATVSKLAESLELPPPRALLQSSPEAEDLTALHLLRRREDVLRAAQGPERVRLLWDVCGIPDFRKLLSEVHADLLAELFLELCRAGRLSDDFLRERVRGLDDTSGEVEVLVARLAAVRTWTYVANRSSWLTSPGEWQHATRTIEDRLSDALHARLVLRFVDPAKASASRRSRPRASGVGRSRALETDEATSRVPRHHPFASLASWRGLPSATPPEGSLPLDARADAWATAVVEGGHEELTLGPTGLISHAPSRRVVGELTRGPSVSQPDVRVALAEDLRAGSKSRLQRRLLAFARDVVGELKGGLKDLPERAPSAAVRGLAHRLERGLGTARARDLADLLPALDATDLAWLAGAGVEVGAAAVFVRTGLTQERLALRAALVTVFFGAGVVPPRLSRGAVSFEPRRGIEAGAFTALGYPAFGPRAVRADVAERVVKRLGEPGAEATPLTEVAGWLGSTVREVARILVELRVLDGPPAAEGVTEAPPDPETTHPRGR